MRFNGSCKILSGLILLQTLAWFGISAQQTSSPALHDRSGESGAGQDLPGQNAQSQQTSTLPGDVSGSYHFTHINDSIEIEIEHDKLTGYISQLGDAQTDRNTPLTFFFDKTSIDGSQIEFQTRVVHGVWYSFRGAILRGKAEKREEDGYYFLHGTLLEHHPQGDEQGKSADETIARRVANYKSMGR